jgi:WD40 repeat protein
MRSFSSLPVLLVLLSASAAFGQEAGAVPKGRVLLVRDPGGHAAAPQHLRFTPDGKKLISAGEDHTVQVWDVRTRERLRMFRLPLGPEHWTGREQKPSGPFDPTRFGTLSAEGQGLRFAWAPLVVDRKGERVSFCTDVNDAQGKPVLTTFVCALGSDKTQVLKRGGPRDFSADGALLALGAGRKVELVEIATDTPRHTATVLPAGARTVVRNLTFSPDGKFLAVVAADANLYLLDGATLKPRNTWAVASKDQLQSVTWVDDQTVVCRSSSLQKTLLVVDAGTGAVKHAYPAAVLLRQFPPRSKEQAVVKLQGVAGSNQVFVLVKAYDSSDTGLTGSFLFNWATGEAGKMFLVDSPYWTSAAAVAPDLSVAAQGDGGRMNFILLWDPRTGKGLKATKALRGYLQPSARGANGTNRSVRWRSDGKAVSWAQSVPRGTGPRAELDLSTLTLRPLTKEGFDRYDTENAALAQDDPPATKQDKYVHVYERGIVRKWGALTLVDRGGGPLVRGGPKPVQCAVGSRVWTDFSFVAGGRVVGHAYSRNVLRVFDSATGEQLHAPRVVHSYIQALAISPRPACRYVLVGSADQTLTVYNPSTNKVLLTIFPAGADWIAWTPEGYYDATPGGERLMGWHLDNGPDRLAGFYPAERFRETLRRPDVIKRVLEKGSVEKALAAANAVLKNQGVAVKDEIAKVEELLPPTVTLDVTDKTKLPRVKLKTIAQAGAAAQPITALRLFVDGRPYDDKNAAVTLPRGVPKDVRNWDITLPPGKHRLRVLARSTDAANRSNEVEIDCRPPQQRPVLHVLAVGIDKYQDKGLNLSCAVNDATLLAATLKDQCPGPLFGAVHPRILLNEKATRKAVLDALEAMRLGPKGRVKDGDLVIVFFAGHGAKEKDRFYLLTHDVKVNNLAGTALAGKQLQSALKKMPCQVLLVMDACHSGAFGAKGTLAAQGLRPATDEATRLLTDDEVGIAVMCAAMGYETAAERNGNGLFTRSLVDALKASKGVPFNRINGRQYVHHLQSYVFDRVTEESQEKQHPFLHLPWVVESFAVRQVQAGPAAQVRRPVPAPGPQ